MVLSEVSSTTWGSRVSQGYQAACFRVSDVELVKNRSAIGMVLEQSGDGRCDGADGGAAEGAGGGGSGARPPPAVHRGLPALELGVLAPALGQLHGREPFGADQRHMAPRGAEQRLIHLEERRVDAQQRLPGQAGRGRGSERRPSLRAPPAAPRRSPGSGPAPARPRSGGGGRCRAARRARRPTAAGLRPGPAAGCGSAGSAGRRRARGRCRGGGRTRRAAEGPPATAPPDPTRPPSLPAAAPARPPISGAERRDVTSAAAFRTLTSGLRFPARPGAQSRAGGGRWRGRSADTGRSTRARPRRHGRRRTGG